MNEMSFFLKIFPLTFNTFIPASFTLVETAPLYFFKGLACPQILHLRRIFSLGKKNVA